ncbi:MAG: HEAT repeat domain-containing protein [Planctomycetota bacterium]
MRILVVALLLGGLVHAQDLAGARQLLEMVREPDVRRGTEMCVKAGNVAAVELLLEVLNQTKRKAGRLAPAHYRDIVWDGLVRITDKAARARVEKELRTSRNKWVRQWCAELLGIYGEVEFAPTLVRALSDKHGGVRRWAARSLGLLRYAGAATALAPLTRAKDPCIRANAIEALAWIDARKYREPLLEALRGDPDAGVRCALLGAAAGIYREDVLGLSAKALADDDWRPRMQAVDNLARIRTKPSVDALVGATADGRPVVGRRAVAALQRLVGKEIGDPDAWKSWWAANRETFEFPEEEEKEAKQEEPRAKPDETRTVAYGIPLVSDHVAFVLDKSLRMRDYLEATKTSKDVAAYRELERVLFKLHGRLVFNVYLYREEVKAFRKEPVPLDRKQQKKALKFVAAQKNLGAKDIWQVLETVVSDPDIDTAYLLSSGEPDVGLYVHWNRVVRHLRDLNRFQKVVVHTVVYSERKWFRDQLERIAEATGGQFKWFK